MYKKLIFLSGLMFFNLCPAFAIDKYTVDGENFSYAFSVYNKGEKLDVGGEEEVSPFNIKKDYLASLNTAAKKWAMVLNTPGKLENVVGYAILADNDYNASATSPYVEIEKYPYQVTAINAVINNLKIVEDDDDDDDDDSPDDIYGIIYIGRGIDKDNPGWAKYSGMHSLYHVNALPDMHTVMLHEIMHSLGITTNAAKNREKSGDKRYYFTDSDNDSLAIFDKDLRLYKGDVSKEFNAADEIVPTSKMRLGKGEEFDYFAYSPYYVGETTLKVLSGEDDYAAARAAIVKNGGFTNYSCSYDEVGIYPKVYGMPIHNSDDDEPDLAHLELRNSFMSHQEYRNWLVPMEAELAVLKDIGYNIELREYFGKSYYLNNITDDFSTGYSEWDGSAYTGNPSTVPQGVGLHIYGNNNNITQSSNISSVGEGSFGVRIDGVNNKYSLLGGSRIEVNGKENLGIAVTWGKNHVINVESGTSVTALGKEGIAIAFDFGDNLFGSISDAFGSYSKYTDTYGISLPPTSENDGELVKQFNVAGTLTGNEAAIYIAENAYVKEINILNGAQINGNIISEWNSVQFGPNEVKIKRKVDGEWKSVDGTVEAQIYFTDINIDKGFAGAINGIINGETIGNNTLRLHNNGKADINGEKIAVYSLENNGAINVESTQVYVQNGVIAGSGELNVGTDLWVDSEIEQIENTINLGQDAMLSTVNENIGNLEIAQLNADNAYISFELGDKYDLQKASKNNKASIAQIVLREEDIEELENNDTVDLFGSADKSLDLGNSYANIYYEGKKYRVTQDNKQKNLLRIKSSGGKMYLPEATADETTAGYIVTEDKQTKDIGLVRGNDFEISGKNVDINGHKGMIVDGRLNVETTLKTDIFGAKDYDVKVMNDGTFKVVAQDKDITLGKQDETAIYVKNAAVELNAKKHKIIADGAIIGAADGKNTLKTTGNEVSFRQVENVEVTLQKTKAEMNDSVRSTLWKIKGSELKVNDDAFLAADGSNRIAANDATIDLINGEASVINLSKLELNGDLNTKIDVDLGQVSADSFAVSDEADIIADEGSLNIIKINSANQNAALTDEEIAIPFISEKAHNTNLLGKVKMAEISPLYTPIFKYGVEYSENENSGSLVLKRGSADEYSSYNPAVAVAPVAMLAGGYLIQLKAYDEAFHNLRLNDVNQAEYTEVMPDKTLWIKPSSTFEKVDLKNGPEVKDKMYNVYAGVDSQTKEVFDRWRLQYGIYAGYNFSRQKYSENTVHQKGGTLGVVSHLTKNNWFNSTTMNAGVDRAEGSTMFGKEHFYLFRYGIADKIGYNWYPYKDNFTVQPNLLLSYTLVKASNYHNAADVSIKSRPLHALNIAPGVNLAYNAANGWQPYADMKVAWSFMNNAKVEAERLNLPEMSVKPYVQYGVGVQKTGSKISGYGQVDFLSGGRSGVEFTAGFKWMFN